MGTIRNVSGIYDTDDNPIWVVGDAAENTTVESTAGSSRTLKSWVDGVQYTYTSIADLDADPALVVGSRVATVGYSNIFDGGGNTYEVVAAGTGTEDGGRYITLSSGLQIKGLFPDGINVVQFGADQTKAVGSTPAIQAALDYAATLVDLPDIPTYSASKVVVDMLGKEYLADGPVSIAGMNNVALRNGSLYADDSFSWEGGAVIENKVFSGRHCDLIDIFIDGKSVANPFYIKSNHFRLLRCSAQHFPDYGIYTDGSQTKIRECSLVQWNSGDPEASISESYTATGVIINHVDCKMSDTIISKCKIPLLLTEDSGFGIYTGNHIFNSIGGNNTPLDEERINIEVRSNNNTFVGNYLDNGYIDLYKFNNEFTGNTFLIGSNVPENTSLFRFIATEVDQEIDAISISGNAKPSYLLTDWYQYVEEDGNFKSKPVIDFTTSEYTSFTATGGRNVIVRYDDASSIVQELRSSTDRALIQMKPLGASSANGAAFGASGEDAVMMASGREIITAYAGSGHVKILATSTGYTRLLLDDEGWLGCSSGGEVSLHSAPNGYAVRLVAETGRFEATQDDSQSLGAPSNRWSSVYASTGSINTSDEREKSDLQALSDAESRVSKKVRSLIGKYKWLSSVEEKGDSARWHFGVGAQSVKEAFESEGLNGFDYGCLCYDEWVDDSGEKQDRYGVRPDELMFFMMAAL